MEIPVALLTAPAGPAPAGVRVCQLIVVPAVAPRLPLSAPLPAALAVSDLVAPPHPPSSGAPAAR